LPPAAAPASGLFLLPTYDEYLIGYAGYGRNRLGAAESQPGPAFNATLLDSTGQVLGSWRRTLEKKFVGLSLRPDQPFTPEQQQAAEHAAQRYGKFLGLEARFL
jgi:hypothetical protein